MFAIQLWIKKELALKKNYQEKNVYSFSWPKCVLIKDIEYICHRGQDGMFIGHETKRWQIKPFSV